MQRILLWLLAALLPLIFDSALKGAALLAVAALTALAMWRASAAARHLVWLVAVVALLVVPVLSVALPQWRVLPGWATGAAVVRAENRPYTPYKPYRAYEEPLAIAGDPAPEEDLSPAPAPVAPFAAAPAAPILHPVSRIPHHAWRDWLPLAWCVGFALLAIRLLAAHLLLRRASRQCPALTAPPDEKIAAAFAQACQQLRITQRVVLLLDKKRTIPVVWGVFRPRLMLPLEAREWSGEQLRSVLLHELAHIKRRDTLVQWLTQIACALHWWNPLVWLAAWRLHTERERACDDLVLASGVRPSAYAEHLLDVATRLSPARWTSACGLAMARKSSLESRLMAVLSEKLNRTGVTRALTAAALILGTAVAIPVAMLRAADDGKLHIRVEGEVKNAQLVGFEKGAAMKTVTAIEKAGGFSDFADVTNIRVTRLGEKSPRLINLKGVIAGNVPDFVLQDGDVVSVERNPAIPKPDVSRMSDTSKMELEKLLLKLKALNEQKDAGAEKLLPAHPRMKVLLREIQTVNDDIRSLEKSTSALKHRGRILDRNGIVLAESAADGKRTYPFKALASHAIGFMGQDDDGTVAGRTGSERAFDEQLLKGEDVKLSIDARLQTVVERTLVDSGVGRAAVVVLDLNDGGIAATASFPNFEPGAFVAGDFFEAAKRYGENDADPLTDRATTAATPGSTFKIVTALAASPEQLRATWDCKGGITYGGRMLKCTGSHGLLDAVGAIKKSCNSYFYNLANRIGRERLEDTARLLGIGSTLDGCLHNDSGFLPDIAWLDANYPGENRGNSAGLLANTGIGQGYVTATPLQLAWVAALTAKAGKAPRPHILDGPSAVLDLSASGTSEEVIKLVRSGMFRVVNEAGGTGGRARSEVTQIAGKTGTAQAYRMAKNASGIAVKEADYRTWFIAYAPAEAPRYSIAVFVETGGNTGSGGRICAPIARKILESSLGELPTPEAIGESNGHFDPVVEIKLANLPLIPGTPAPAPLETKMNTVFAASGPVGNPTPEIITNSLGMEFVLIGKTDFARNLVRVKDYELFAAANPRDVKWKNPGFPQTPEHPVVFVTWEDAMAFCEWLTKVERDKGLLKANEAYRLPTDLEWSAAAGMPPEKGATPEERDLGEATLFPWGTAWPPPAGVGNYAGEEVKSDVSLKGYRDDFQQTAPVGSFTPNALGLFDMGGNAWQWTADDLNELKERKALRGASWYNGGLKQTVLLSCRISAKPTDLNDTYGFRIVKAVTPEPSKPNDNELKAAKSNETRAEARKRLAIIEADLAVLKMKHQELLKELQPGHHMMIAMQGDLDQLSLQRDALLPLATEPGQGNLGHFAETIAEAKKRLALLEVDLAVLEVKRVLRLRDYQPGHQRVIENQQAIDALKSQRDALLPLAGRQSAFDSFFQKWKDELKKEAAPPEPAHGAANGVLWGAHHDVRRKVFLPRETSPYPFIRSSTSVELDPELADKLEGRPLQSLRMGRRASTKGIDELRTQYEAIKRLFEAGSVPSHVFYMAREAYFAAMRER